MPGVIKVKPMFIKSVFSNISNKFFSSAVSAAEGRTFLDTLLCIGLSVLFLLGAMLAFFGIATAKMLTIALAAGVAVCFLFKKLPSVFELLDSLGRHPLAAICAAIGVGLVIRILFYYVHLKTGLEAHQPGDGHIFFNEAKEMAAGAFPETKSWVTVGSYALMIRIFGESLLPSCLLNIILQTVSAILLYRLGREMFDPFGGMLAAMAFYWSPNFISMGFQLYAEHFFYLLVLLQFLLLFQWLDKGGLRYPAALGILIPVTLWTKPDAAIFVSVIMVFCAVAGVFIDPGKIKASLLGCGVTLIAVCCGLCCGSFINQKYHGTRTCLCSEDGCWPAYFGANRFTQGRAKMEDKLAMYEAYRKKTGKTLVFRHNHCPAELVPCVKAETLRRWSAMTFKEKLRHIHTKETYSWQTVEMPSYRKAAIRKIHTIFKVFVWFWGGTALLLLARQMLSRRKADPTDVLRVMPVLYLIGTYLCIVLAESNFRYAGCANVFLPLYLGCAFSRLKQKYQRRAEVPGCSIGEK